MPITIGTMTSRVTVNDGNGGGPSPEELERLVAMVAAKLKQMEMSADNDGEIPRRRSSN